MRAEDIDGVMEIERVSFPTPWSRRLFEEEVGRAISSPLVAESDPGNRLLGYAILWTTAGESHLLNIAVRPEARGQGVGQALLRECIRRAAAVGSDAIYLEVRQSNRVAIRLYDREGFRFMGVRKGYYTDTREDALVYVRVIGEDDAS